MVLRHKNTVDSYLQDHRDSIKNVIAALPDSRDPLSISRVQIYILFTHIKGEGGGWTGTSIFMLDDYD